MAQALQKEFIRQCKYYNTVYLQDRKQEGTDDNLTEIDHHELIKGVGAFEKHVPNRFTFKAPRMSLDLSKMDELLDNEHPDREKWAEQLSRDLKSGEDENDSVKVMKGLEAKLAFIPGRGQVTSKSELNRKLGHGRGALIRSMLMNKN